MNTAGRWQSVAQAGALVLLFWWLATGLLLGLPSSGSGRQVAAIVASLIGGSGLALAILMRHDTSPRAAWLGFLAGGTIWAWAQAALYGGWLVGPSADVIALPASRLGQAVEALRLTAWSEVASLGVLLLAGVIAIGARNRLSFWTVLVLWTAHQFARVNVFLGVENASPEFLPTHLAFLQRFFGPAANSGFLVPSILIWGVISVLLLRRGWHRPDLFARRAALMLGVLAGLAALEHIFLAIPSDIPLWNGFLPGA